MMSARIVIMPEEARLAGCSASVTYESYSDNERSGDAITRSLSLSIPTIQARSVGGWAPREVNAVSTVTSVYPLSGDRYIEERRRLFQFRANENIATPKDLYELTRKPWAGHLAEWWESNGDWESEYYGTVTVTIHCEVEEYQVWFEPTNDIEIKTESEPTNGGTTSGGGWVVRGSRVSIEAKPNKSYGFKHWKRGNDVVSNDARYTFTANESATYTAVFGRILNVEVHFTGCEGSVVSGLRASVDGKVATSDGNGIAKIEEVAEGDSEFRWDDRTDTRTHANDGNILTFKSVQCNDKWFKWNTTNYGAMDTLFYYCTDNVKISETEGAGTSDMPVCVINVYIVRIAFIICTDRLHDFMSWFPQDHDDYARLLWHEFNSNEMQEQEWPIGLTQWRRDIRLHAGCEDDGSCGKATVFQKGIPCDDWYGDRKSFRLVGPSAIFGPTNEIDVNLEHVLKPVYGTDEIKNDYSGYAKEACDEWVSFMKEENDRDVSKNPVIVLDFSEKLGPLTAKAVGDMPRSWYTGASQASIRVSKTVRGISWYFHHSSYRLYLDDKKPVEILPKMPFKDVDFSLEYLEDFQERLKLKTVLLDGSKRGITITGGGVSSVRNIDVRGPVSVNGDILSFLYTLGVIYDPTSGRVMHGKNGPQKGVLCYA